MDRPIPAALRPKPRAKAAQDDITIHVSILVQNPKLADIVKRGIRIVGPMTGPPVHVKAHIVYDDKDHPASNLDLRIRQALAELELVDPDAVGFTFPEQVTLGWTTPED